MVIRKAKEGDLESIVSLQSQIYRIDKPDKNAGEVLKKQLSDNTCEILVVEENEKIIATGVIYFIEVAVRAKPYAFLEGIVVDKKLRGHGIGTEFFQEIIKICKEKNCYKILFTSGADRQDAHKFYEKLAFKKWGLEFRMNL